MKYGKKRKNTKLFALIKKNTIKIKKFNFLNKIRYDKNIDIENYLPESGLEILIRKFFDKMYILYFIVKNTIENRNFFFLN